MKLHVAIDKVLAAARSRRRHEHDDKKKHELAEAISIVQAFSTDQGEFIRLYSKEE